MIEFDNPHSLLDCFLPSLLLSQMGKLFIALCCFKPAYQRDAGRLLTAVGKATRTHVAALRTSMGDALTPARTIEEWDLVLMISRRHHVIVVYVAWPQLVFGL